jgi:hypothetical protein
MSVWVVLVASAAWLAVSTAITTGSFHGLLLWAAGMVVACGLFGAIRGVRRHPPRTTGNDQDVTAAADTPAEPAMSDDGATATGSSTGANTVGGAAGHCPTPNMVSGPPQPSPQTQPSTEDGMDSMAGIEGHTARITGLPVVLTAKEAASLLQVPEDELVAAIRAGLVPGNHVGDRWRCSAGALHMWLDGDWKASEK